MGSKGGDNQIAIRDNKWALDWHLKWWLTVVDKTKGEIDYLYNTADTANLIRKALEYATCVHKLII